MLILQDYLGTSENISEVFVNTLSYFVLLIFHALDVSGIIEKFNVHVTLAIIPKMKDINKAF